MNPLLEVRNANLSFPTRRGLFGRGTAVPVLRDVSLRLETGQVLGIVGESGSGKSTLARLVLRLLKADSGAVLIDGQDHRDLSPRAFAAAVQPVFQDPYSSLNPKRTLAQILEMPLVLAGDLVAEERRTRVRAMLDRVGLPQRLLHSYPAQLSGGQRQRVAIARALMVRPRLLICDEPTSALDVSVQAQILQLFDELRRDFGLTCLFISHNLAVIERIADRVGVMYRGQIVEDGEGRTFFAGPQHAYSRLLLSSTLPPIPGRPLPDVARPWDAD
ncbi:ATP-binding cassette domain-containing protein [Pararhodobacter sp.]|uniref:ATP-binding cassette domain-containing protein n=1 Tax=Pararhodobacter sp. TaxID=2127056 RepID=UPI002FE0BFF7